jgi:hypothetical protein
MALASVSRFLSDFKAALGRNNGLGWYDSVHDEELGSQPCIFTSVSPVRVPCYQDRTIN